MRENHRTGITTAQLLGIIFATALAASVVPAFAVPPTAATTVPCRVLEAERSEQFGMAIVIFHYRDEADRERLGTLLRKHNGATVQFQTADRQWHTATVFRLKTCFGRGLMLFPGAHVHLAAHDQFILQFEPPPAR